MVTSGTRDYNSAHEQYSNGEIAAVMAAVAALTGTAVPVDSQQQQQQKQYQILQLQAAAQQLQHLQSAALLQQQQHQSQQQAAAAAAAIIAAAAQQQQQQQLNPLLYNRPAAPAPLTSQATAVLPITSLARNTTSNGNTPAASMLPYMSLTPADYEDGEQSSDESEEMDDAKSRGPPQAAGTSHGGGGSTSTDGGGTSSMPVPSEKQQKAPLDRLNDTSTNNLRMLVDVVSDTEKGCQVWMDSPSSRVPTSRCTKEPPVSLLKKRKAKLDSGGSGGSSSGGSGGSESHVDTNGRNPSKRMRLIWTPELHGRFLHAVNHLGVSQAVPKTILQMINVGGMTRENVASHLQKYRLYLKKLAGLPASAPLRTTDTLRQLQHAQHVAAAASGAAPGMNATLTTAELISQLEAMNARHSTPRTNTAVTAAVGMLPGARAVPPASVAAPLNLCSVRPHMDLAAAFGSARSSLAASSRSGHYDGNIGGAQLSYGSNMIGPSPSSLLRQG